MDTVKKTPSRSYVPLLGPAKPLYESARKSIAAGNMQKAGMEMERALRIEPRNGHYWYTLAQIKYREGRYDQVVQLCLKSKSFAGRNSRLTSLNDMLINKAQQQSRLP